MVYVASLVWSTAVPAAFCSAALVADGINVMPLSESKSVFYLNAEPVPPSRDIKDV